MTKSSHRRIPSQEDGKAKPAAPPKPDWCALVAILFGGGVCALLVHRAPFLGHDWMVGFAPELADAQHPAWATPLLRPLTNLPPRIGLALMNGLTLSSAPRLAVPALVFALLNPISWMLFQLGDMEATMTVGLTMLPIGIPLLLTTPHIGPWANFSSRLDLLYVTGSLAISPGKSGLRTRSILTRVITHRISRLLSMDWLSIHPIVGLVGVAPLPATTYDPLCLIATGAPKSLFIVPHHHYSLLPALGPTRGYRQLALWLASWSTVLTTGNQEHIAIQAI